MRGIVWGVNGIDGCGAWWLGGKGCGWFSGMLRM